MPKIAKITDIAKITKTPRTLIRVKIPTRKNASDTYKAYAMQKAYLPMHYAWQFPQLYCLPNFCLVTDLLPVCIHDAD